MISLTTNGRVRCILYTQILFTVGLFTTGLIVFILTSVQLNSILWSCPILNTYYAVVWLSLVLGGLQFILGVSGGILLWLQPRFISSKINNLLLVGESCKLGQIVPQPINCRGNSWVIDLTPPKPPRSIWSRLFCGGSSGSQHLDWMRPAGIAFGLILVLQVVAFAITITFLSRALQPDTGVAEQVFTLFTEAKVDLIPQLYSHDSLSTKRVPATDCWVIMESEMECCGAQNFMDWFTNSVSPFYDNPSLGFPSSSRIRTLIAHCGCTAVDDQNCKNTTIPISATENESVMLYQRGCSASVTDVVLWNLKMLIVVLPISVSVALLTFIVSLMVTLRVAQLELINNSKDSSEDLHTDSHPLQASCFASKHRDSFDVPQQKRLSLVAEPALRSFSLGRIEC